MKHGLSHSRLYGIWHGMKQRCYNKQFNRYHYYGGRGICICDEWHDFIKFYDIDNDRGYSPENCRWATKIEQRSNQRNSRRYNYNGIDLTISELAKLSIVSKAVLSNRIRLGWPIDMALNTGLCTWIKRPQI